MDFIRAVMFLVFIALLIIGAIGGLMYVVPQYQVYSERQAGMAELQRAESNRQIKVYEAQATLDAADLTAQAEVRRAQGVADANRIIADSLGGSEGYLRWRYIEMLENTSSGGRDVIYIPTEAGLPILEAGKRGAAMNIVQAFFNFLFSCVLFFCRVAMSR